MIFDQKTIMNHLWHGQDKTVSGWWKDCLFQVYESIDLHQKRHGIRGNLAEVGVWQGRSLVPLVNLKGEDEKVVAVDIRDVSQPRAFVESVFGELPGVSIIQSNSSDRRIFKAAAPYRMFYIDGDHSFRGAMTDLETASSVVTDGVIFLDDFDNPRYGPNVRKAIDKFIAGNRTWKIVGITCRTIWISRAKTADGYLSVFAGLGWQRVEDVFYKSVPSFQHRDMGLRHIEDEK